MTDSYQQDLDQAALRAQIDTLAAMWREAAVGARTKADSLQISEDARYWAGYADAKDHDVQALRGLEEQW